MKVIDPGHLYDLEGLDRGLREVPGSRLRFVKRIEFEMRAARERGDAAAAHRIAAMGEPELAPICPGCGHILCERHDRPSTLAGQRAVSQSALGHVSMLVRRYSDGHSSVRRCSAAIRPVDPGTMI